MDYDEARRFADQWAADWNSHDLERVLSHFADDVVFRSPHVARWLDSPDGTVHGKDALRAYWTEGLKRLPSLRFEIVEVYTGVTTVVINYRNEFGQLVNEILTFDGGLVVSGEGTYAPRPA